MLLPLEIAPQDGGAAEVWAQARERLLREDPAEIEPLLAAAPRGQAAVESALAALLAEPLGVLREDEDYEDEGLE